MTRTAAARPARGHDSARVERWPRMVGNRIGSGSWSLAAFEGARRQQAPLFDDFGPFPARPRACARGALVARTGRLVGGLLGRFPQYRACCRSSVVEHSIGNGEVDSSILSGSTIHPVEILGRQCGKDCQTAVGCARCVSILILIGTDPIAVRIVAVVVCARGAIGCGTHCCGPYRRRTAIRILDNTLGPRPGSLDDRDNRKKRR